MAFLQDLPFQRNPGALAAFEHLEQARLFVLQIFFGIDAAVHGEPALLRDDTEIGAAAALPAEHQDGMAALLGADVAVSASLFDFSLQFLELLNDAEHAFKGVLTLMLQTYVRGLAKHF